jgi:hypothetical protein
MNSVCYCGADFAFTRIGIINHGLGDTPMSRTKTTFLALLVLLSPMAANAGLIKINATSQLPSSFGNFEIVFEDDDDGLLQWDEIVFFSGVSCGLCGEPELVLANIFRVPDFEFGTLSSDPSVTFSSTGNSWNFGNDIPWAGATSTLWTYEVPSSSVPEPGTLGLLGLGLLGLSAARLKRKA